MATALAGFLKRFPQVDCVVSGRPHSIGRFWDDLFAHADWEFAQIDVFSEEEQKRYVGPQRWAKMQQLAADVIAVPRMLETVLNLDPEELEGVRTAADLYWRALDASLNEAFAGQDLKIRRPEAERLYALIACELHQADNFTGIAAAEFETFVTDTWNKRQSALSKQYTAWRDLQSWIQELGRVNEVLDFAVMEDSGEQELYFRDRTLLDFFAALWMARYASGDDLGWLRQHRHLRGPYEEHFAEAERYHFWHLAAEMPFAARPAKAHTWVAAARVLFTPDPETRTTLRSTEMMYRAWWGLLELAGRIGRGATERQMQAATTALQQEVRSAFKAGELAWDPQAKLPPAQAAAALHVLQQYLVEFLAIRYGKLLVKGQPNAAAIAREFDTQWFVPIPAGPFHMGEANDVAHIETSFELAKYPVTNELYALFDPGHAARIGEYAEFSGGPRCPAIYINWYDAWCAATWLHGELPDEYQWECACRGQRGTDKPPTRWCCGDKEAQLKKYAWYDANAMGETHPVDGGAKVNSQETKLPNGFGLYHMHGNTWEWTSSWYAKNPRKGRDPGDVGSSRVLRGGSWRYDAGRCRSAFRSRYAPGRTGHYNGFRVCRASVES